MTESYGYYTYGDIKAKWLQGTPSIGSILNNPDTQINLVSKNAFSSKTEIAKNYDTSKSVLSVSKNALCNGTSLVKSANSHFDLIDMTAETKSYDYDILDTKNVQVSTADIGFYEITTIGQIAKYNLSIIPTPPEALVKINDVAQSSYNGYETEDIRYEISSEGYATRIGNIHLMENTELNITLPLKVHLTINVEQEDAIVTVNDIEGKEHTFGQGDEVTVKVTCAEYKTYTNTFIIEEDTVLDVVLQSRYVTVVYPSGTLPSTVSTSGIGSSSSSAFYKASTNLYSNSGSYNVNNGSSYAYIKFTTPNKSTTLSVQAYTSSESNYDFGAVYVGTKSYSPTQSQMKSGTTDGYGSYLVRTSGKNSSYTTYSMPLAANTTYYINLKYAKDGSGHTGNDRFYIRNITFVVDGG
jgi:hypothetical protein